MVDYWRADVLPQRHRGGLDACRGPIGLVVEHAERAGSSVVTIFVGDLDSQVAAVAVRGLEPDERLTLSNGVRKALYRDPDGNERGFSGVHRSLPTHRDFGALAKSVRRGAPPSGAGLWSLAARGGAPTEMRRANALRETQGLMGS